MNLEHSGHKVLRAASAEEAEAAIRKALPDVLVLDWMLPGESGVAFARRLRTNERTRDLPILMLTARAMEQTRSPASKPGPRLPHQAVLAEGARRAHQAVLRRRAPQLSGDAVEVEGLRLDPATRRVSANGQRVELAPSGSACSLLHDAPGARLHARAAPRPRLGRSRVHRRAHRGRAHPPPAQGAGGHRPRPAHRHGARLGLLLPPIDLSPRFSYPAVSRS